MKKQALIFTAIVVTLMTLTSFAFAGISNGKRNRGNNDCPRFMNNPGQQWAALTQEQKNQIMDLRQKFVDETAPQRVVMVSNHEAIRILMETTSPDRNQLNSLTAELADAQKIMMTKGVEFALQVKAIAPKLQVPMMFHGMGKGMGRFEGRGKFHGPKKGRPHCFPKPNCPLLQGTPELPSGDEAIPTTE
ncbi:Spy/CpxP family protein refolding chaperone [Desulfocicer niacini]